MKWACDRLTGFWRIAAADIFLFFSFVGTVNVWRGVWQLLDIYFLPGKFTSLILNYIFLNKKSYQITDDKLLGDLITHGVSFVLLALLNCSNSVLVRGVYVDAEEPAGQCVIFPVYYIRLFFQKERTKKQKRLLDALEKGDHNVFLLDKSSVNAGATIVKSSQKAIELTAMLNNRITTDNGIKEKQIVNGEHIITK